MSLTLQQVRHVASLARLELTSDQEIAAQKELSAVLDAIEALANVDVSNIEPTSAFHADTGPLRDDVVQPTLGTQAALANAPACEGTSFSVPKVIE